MHEKLTDSDQRFPLTEDPERAIEEAANGGRQIRRARNAQRWPHGEPVIAATERGERGRQLRRYSLRMDALVQQLFADVALAPQLAGVFALGGYMDGAQNGLHGLVSTC